MNIKELTGSNILKGAHNSAKEQGASIFLVGGAIRDLLLSSQIGKDFDFVLQGDVQKVAGVFAERAMGSFFCMDPKRGHYRVTIRGKARGTNIDFSGFRGDGIGEDLKKRDFTINSMAINLKDLFEKHKINIIDPLNGLKDIEKGIIRACSSRVFDDDPLRLLRAIRISVTTNFAIEDKTEGLIRDKSELLTDSSWERVRDELFQILYPSRAYESIERLDSLGLLRIILPEIDSWRDIDQGEHHDYNLFDHAVKTVKFIETVLSDLPYYFPDHASSLKSHFKEEIENNITRGNLIKLIAFLHDSGKVRTRSCDGEKVRFLGHDRVGYEINKAIAKRLKLGRKASRIIASITKNHMRILNLSGSVKITQRALYRFFRDLDEDGIDCLILSLADGLATRIPETSQPVIPLLSVIQDFMKYYFEGWRIAPTKPLLNGREVMTLLGITEGREVGRVLSVIKEAMGEGSISTKEEAENLAISTHTRSDSLSQ